MNNLTNLLLVKTWPELDLRYFLNLRALSLLEKTQYQTNL